MNKITETLFDNCISQTIRKKIEILFFFDLTNGYFLFRFPRFEDMRYKWLKLVGRKGFEPTQSSRLCSNHFTLDCFVPNKLIRTLKKDAVPSIFPYFKRCKLNTILCSFQGRSKANFRSGPSMKCRPPRPHLENKMKL